MQHGSSVMSLCRAVGNKPDSDAHARQEAPVVALSDSLRTCNDVTGTDCITWWRSHTSRCRSPRSRHRGRFVICAGGHEDQKNCSPHSVTGYISGWWSATDSDTSPADPLAQKPIDRFICYAPAPRVGGIKRWCASDVCLSGTSGPKSREA